MIRLPKQFEKEVLSKHNISWPKYDTIKKIEPHNYYRNGELDWKFRIRDYEIAGIILSTMNEVEASNVFANIANTGIDFCECVFKTIRSQYE